MSGPNRSWHSLVSLPPQDSPTTLTEEKIIQFINNPFITGDLGECQALIAHGIRLFLYLPKTLLTTLTEEKIIQFNPFIPGDLGECQALIAHGIRLFLYTSPRLS